MNRPAAALPAAPRPAADVTAGEPLLRTALAFALAVVAAHATRRLVGTPVAEATAVAAVVAGAWRVPRLVLSPLLWGAVSALMGALAFARADAANHTYLQFYLSLAFAACLTLPRGEVAAGLAASARWLLAAVMLAATVQKLLAPEFLDGRFLCYTTLIGGFSSVAGVALHPPEVQAVLAGNAATDKAFLPPVEVLDRAYVVLENPFGDGLDAACIRVALATIVLEAVMAVGFALRPRAAWPHVLLVLFAVSLVLVRPEVMFISTLMALGATSALALRTPRMFGVSLAVGCIALAMCVTRIVTVEGSGGASGGAG